MLNYEIYLNYKILDSNVEPSRINQDNYNAILVCDPARENIPILQPMVRQGVLNVDW